MTSTGYWKSALRTTGNILCFIEIILFVCVLWELFAHIVIWHASDRDPENRGDGGFYAELCEHVSSHNYP